MWGENDRVNRGNLIKNMHQKRKNMKRIKKNLQKKITKKLQIEKTIILLKMLLLNGLVSFKTKSKKVTTM
ncbi:hypothetical protein F280043A3_10550 [Intestinibacter bartlettii]